MQTSMIMRWLLGGLYLGFHLGPAAAMPQDATTSDAADVQASEDIESGVESPVSNPEVGEAPVLDESTFLLGDWGGAAERLVIEHQSILASFVWIKTEPRAGSLKV